MTSIIEDLRDRSIGIVESVAPNSITVLVDPNAPQATALNTGTPAGFPRINGYLLVPNESGATVGVITSVRVERLSGLKQRGSQECGLVDLPFSARIVSLTPLGTLSSKPSGSDSGLRFTVRRGVDVFPSVGDPVMLPTEAQLRAVVEGEDAAGEGRILLGSCPTAAGMPVYIDPDKIFGRHLAVLGNTGAGKSCTVAGLIRWSIASAQKARQARGATKEPNARFIILDPNGEYAKAFRDLNVRVFQVEPTENARPLKTPAWLWNGEEWAAFAGAAPGVQRPILFEAIRRLRSGSGEPDEFQTRVRGRVRRYRTGLKLKIQGGDHLAAGKREGVAQSLLNLASDLQPLVAIADANVKSLLESVVETAGAVEQSARGKPREVGHWHNDFAETELEKVLEALNEVAVAVGLGEEDVLVGEDEPRFFSARELPGFVEALAADTTGRDISQFVDSLTLRIRGLFATGVLSSVADPGSSASVKLHEWLSEYVGADQAVNGQIAVIDLSLIPSDVVHVVVAVLARMVFESVQRYRRENGAELPTVLVLEEAHTFINRELVAEGASAAGRMCCRTFERIAREGRKFGLGLVLSSQRPSEVSPTVLSQCNTFLLHRIVNDRDQDLVKRLVPEGLGDLLRELPSLPSRRAILLGWGAPAPLLVEVQHLPDDHRPQSPDPSFWDVWTGKTKCQIDWKAIEESWTKPSLAVEELGFAGQTETGESPEDLE